MLPLFENVVDRAMESRDPASAEEAFRHFEAQLKATEAPRDRANILYGKAVLYGALGRFDDARKEARIALQQAPDDWFTQMQYDFITGGLDDEEGKTVEAYEHLTQALAKHANALRDPDLRFIYENAQLRRGSSLVRLGRMEEAVPILEEALSFKLDSGTRALVLARLGRCYTGPSQWEKVRDCLEEALKVPLIAEWAAQSHYSLGIAYAYLRRLKESKHQFQICEEHAEEYAKYGLPLLRVYDWLSRICKALGEKTESERYARLARPI